jgi:ligand-binding sensor domain-containing protein
MTIKGTFSKRATYHATYPAQHTILRCMTQMLDGTFLLHRQFASLRILPYLEQLYSILQCLLRFVFMICLRLGFSYCVIVFLVYATILRPPTALAQDVRRLPATPGAPQSLISSMLQDKRGFLWCATDAGAYRYDGRSFTLYRPASTSSAPENAVNTLCLDSAGTLWLGTASGLYFFDARANRLHFYADSLLSKRSIDALCTDGHGKLYAASENILFVIPITSVLGNGRGTSASMSIPIPIPETKRINALAWFGTQVLIGTNAGLKTFAPAIASVRAIPLPFSVPDITSITTLRGNEIAVGTRSHGVLQVNVLSGSVKILTSGVQPVLALCQDAERTIWCGTAGDGLLQITNSRNAERTATVVAVSASGRFFTSMFQDKQGIVWFGTTDGSLYMFDRTARKFAPFAPFDGASSRQPPLDTALRNLFTLCIYEDSEGCVWIGTERGLLRYLPASVAKDNRANWRLFSHNDRDKTSISANTISCIYEDTQKIMWVGTTAGGLNAFDRRTGTFTHYTHQQRDSTSISSNNISCIYEDSRSRLWVGTWLSGVNLLDRATGKCTSYRSTPQKISTLSSNSVSCIAEDRMVADGTLWIGTYEDGLNAFHPTIQAFTRHKNDPRNPRSLSSNAVSSIYELQDGTLWITSDAGLDKFDRRSQVFTRYGEANGLPNETLSAVVGDAHGKLWIMTESKIVKFDPHTERAHAYDASDGLTIRSSSNSSSSSSSNNGDAASEPPQFSSRAYFMAPDGHIYFGTTSGFVRFHPDSVRDNAYKPPVVLTALRKFNAPAQLSVSITEADEIVLSYTDTFITFEFAALNFSFPEKNRYRYKLDGFDEYWIDAGTKNEAVYTNLDGGEYTFRVQACNNDGVWNMTGARLRVVVTPPFWQTGWFYAASGLCFGLVLWGGVRWRVRRLRARTAELTRVVDDRTAQLQHSLQEVKRLNDVLNAHNAELAEQTRTAQLEMLRYQLNPHFLFNALISISDLTREDPEHGIRALATLMAYMRYALQPAGLPTVKLSEEIHAVRSYLTIEQVRFEERLEVKFVIQQEAEAWQIPGFMLQPLVENAVKYGMRTSPMPLKIEIAARVPKANILEITITNSGSLTIPGHTTKPEGTGTGMRNVRERLQVLFPARHSVDLWENDRHVSVRVMLESKV